MGPSGPPDTHGRRGPPAARPLTPTHATSVPSEERGPRVTSSTGTAPGKVILFGEHSVVYGQPALALSVTALSKVSVRTGKRRSRVNGDPLNIRQHRFILKALQVLEMDDALDFRTDSDVPSAAGMGSSAALSTATIAALLAYRDGQATKAQIARLAYETEWRGQGNRGSPTDTSACTLGGGMLIGPRPWSEVDADMDDPPAVQWSLSRARQRWYVHGVPVPDAHLVVAHSGQKGKTAQQVAKVSRFVKRSPAGPDVIEDMGHVTAQGIRACRDGDLARVGTLMNEYHFLLNLCGVGTRRLDEMAYVARKHAYGAKITGAGGGGCILALTDRPDACAKALKDLGCGVYRVDVDHDGARWTRG